MRELDVEDVGDVREEECEERGKATVIYAFPSASHPSGRTE